MPSVSGSTIERRRIIIQGIVQGVGFRPFVYGQALQWKLVGFVLNDSGGVTIEVEGTSESLDGFQEALYEKVPPLARIDTLSVESIAPCYDSNFTIAQSQASTERQALISPDTATCDDCQHELFDTGDRRFHYPFINCTNCGPRFTIIQDVPYDRDKTTMRVFPMCWECQSEYEDPLNRRFHAQPNACPTCGPQVYLLDKAGDTPLPLQTNNQIVEHSKKFDKEEYPPEADNSAMGTINRPLQMDNEETILKAAKQLARGAILAIKGLGGYHLACDALNDESVRQLRQRKHREAKPFALMVPDLDTARKLCRVSDTEASLLTSHRRPIVLLSRFPDCPIAPDVAPAYDTVGIMLPYTPLHHVLLHAFTEQMNAGRPAVLVMTSGNLSDEPIAYKDEDATQRLATIADGTLAHNREIHIRCDDSVIRLAAGGEQLFRRSRGYAPEPLMMSFDFPEQILACGAHLKNTFCLGKGRQALLSHHIGDLENLETLTSFREGIEHFQRIFDIHPEAVAYDLHPEYLATKYALDTNIPQKIGVQHHHAHIASVLAEHGLQGPIIGIAADGTGYGTDGAVWGCEIMKAELSGFERLAHLDYMPLPGGEQAVHQPWRMAAVNLAQAYGNAFSELDIPFVQQLDHSKWGILTQMIAQQINCPPTSSLGRLFDAVAALIGLRSTVLYEGQAAIELEILARQHEGSIYKQPSDFYPFTLRNRDKMPAILDVAPMFRAIVYDIQQGVLTSHIARRFHYSISELLATACSSAREQTGLHAVALSGGVFQNQLLLERLVQRLEEMAFQVYINRRVPPNDGGISLGQIAVAAAIMQRRDDAC
ncbi:MAG: carbamoyltransferase HypF [Ktedonobacteraceae bacterium]